MESSDKMQPESNEQAETTAPPDSSEVVETADESLPLAEATATAEEPVSTSLFAPGQEVRISLIGTLVEPVEDADAPGDKFWLVEVGDGVQLRISEENLRPSLETADAISTTKSFKEKAVGVKNKVTAVASQAALGLSGRASLVKATMSEKASYAGDKLNTFAEKATSTGKSAGEWVGSKAVSIKNRIVDGSSVVKVETIRRRLTIGGGGSGIEKCVVVVSEEDRGSLQYLNDHSISDLLESDDFTWMASENDSGKTAFGSKEMQHKGENLAKQPGLGIACRKGLKPESPNQDSWSLVQIREQFSLFGVFDGHGLAGHEISNFVKELLPKLILNDPRFKTERSAMESIFTDAFDKMQRFIEVAHSDGDFDASLCGTTATLVFYDHSTKKITVAHIGDSTACLVSLGESPTRRGFSLHPLTRDHKPELSDEKSYIESKGGEVKFDGYSSHRVYAKESLLGSSGRYPGLNVSRAFGDLLGHRDAGIKCEPEISTHDLDTEQLLLLCSDGVWNFITFDEAAAITKDFHVDDYVDGANKVAKEAWDRWISEEGGTIVDDITVMLVNFTALKLPAPTVEASEDTAAPTFTGEPDAAN